MDTYSSPVMRRIPLIVFWLYALLLVVLSLLPGQGLTRVILEGELFIRADYLLHGLAFLGLALLAHFAARSSGSRSIRWAIWVVVFALAVGMEFIQLLTVGRTFNPIDLLSNAIGIAIALLLVVVLSRRR